MKKLNDYDETWLVLGFFLVANKKYGIEYEIFPPTIKKIIEENDLREKFL